MKGWVADYIERMKAAGTPNRYNTEFLGGETVTLPDGSCFVVSAHPPRDPTKRFVSVSLRVEPVPSGGVYAVEVRAGIEHPL